MSKLQTMKTNLKPLFRITGLFDAAGFVILLGACATFLARFGWVFDLASHFKVQYAITLPFIGVLFFLLKRRKTGIAMCCLALAHALSIRPYLQTETPSALPTAPSLRVMMMNVLTENTNTVAALNEIQKTNPDVLLLIEPDPMWMRKLRTLESDYPYKLSKIRSDNFGMALLSKLPLTNPTITYFEEGDIPTLKATLTIDNHPITFIGFHSLPPRNPSRWKKRNEHFQELAEICNAQTNPVIVAADFNCTPWSPFFKKLCADAALTPAMLNRGLINTWPVQAPILRIPIDQYLISAELEVRHLFAGESIDSDHKPLVLDVYY